MRKGLMCDFQNKFSPDGPLGLPIKLLVTFTLTPVLLRVAVKEVIKLFGHFMADALDVFQVGLAGAGDSGGRAEMLEQGAFATGANAGHFI